MLTPYRCPIFHAETQTGPLPPYLGRDRTADGAVLVVAFVDQETHFTFTMSINRNIETKLTQTWQSLLPQVITLRNELDLVITLALQNQGLISRHQRACTCSAETKPVPDIRVYSETPVPLRYRTLSFHDAHQTHIAWLTGVYPHKGIRLAS